jgi:hypothetical protein
MKGMWMRIAVLSFLVCAGIASAQEKQTSAQRLVDQLPPELLGFVATSGGDDLQADFDQSNLGKVWHEPSVQTFYQQIKSELLKKLYTEIKKENDKTGTTTALELAKLLLRSPMVGAVGASRTLAKPEVYGFLIVQAGDRQKAIADNITAIERLAQAGDILDVTIGSVKMHRSKFEDGTPALWGWVGDRFIVVVNDEKAEIVSYLTQHAAAPTANSAYRAALAKVPGTDDLKLVYVDVAKIIDTINRHLQGQTTQPMPQPLAQILNALGLQNIQSLTGRYGFSGPDSVGNIFLAVTNPETSLFACFRPVDLGLLDLVPAQAVEAKTANVDLAGLYDRVMNTIKTVDPIKYLEAEKKITEFETQAGFKIRGGFLENLAGPLVTYSMPSAGMMMSPAGGVLILRLKDAKQFEQSLLALEKYIAELAQGNLQITVQKMDDQDFHIWVIPQLALMQVSPCWTIRGNDFVIAPNASTCQAAVNHATTRDAAASSIRTVPGFKQVAQNLPEKIISFHYIDRHGRPAEGPDPVAHGPAPGQ